MSQCMVPNWNLKQQRQEEQVEGEELERNRSPHVHSDQNLSYVVPMSNYEVTELTWENGQRSLHGLGGIISPNPSSTPQTKQNTWNPTKPGDHTLESIVHQATFCKQNKGIDERKWRENSTTHMQIQHNEAVKASTSMEIHSSCGKWGETSSDHMLTSSSRSGKRWELNNLRNLKMDEGKLRSVNGGGNYKRVRTETATDDHQRKVTGFDDDHVEESDDDDDQNGTATFCRDNTGDTTMMTWPPASSFESPRSFKNGKKVNADEHDFSACHCSENQDGERTTKGESSRSQSSARRSRAAAVHNLSERRRRDKINEKMKALQKLVPNASKTDKASMLDEVIEYVKQLQAQVHMMSNARNMPQMMMPLGMQQQIQMSLLARMGMGMGMLDVNNLAQNMPHSISPLIHPAGTLGSVAPSFVSSHFTMPTPLKANVNAANISTSMPNFNDAYNTFIAQQSMNMDFLNKMAALYRQQANQPSKKPATFSQPSNGQGE